MRHDSKSAGGLALVKTLGVPGRGHGLADGVSDLALGLPEVGRSYKKTATGSCHPPYSEGWGFAQTGGGGGGGK